MGRGRAVRDKRAADAWGPFFAPDVYRGGLAGGGHSVSFDKRGDLRSWPSPSPTRSELAGRVMSERPEPAEQSRPSASDPLPDPPPDSLDCCYDWLTGRWYCGVDLGNGRIRDPATGNVHRCEEPPYGVPSVDCGDIRAGGEAPDRYMPGCVIRIVDVQDQPNGICKVTLARICPEVSRVFPVVTPPAAECCVKVMCGGIPILEDVPGVPVEHCWIEKKNCGDRPHRFDLWQNLGWLDGLFAPYLPAGVDSRIVRDGAGLIDPRGNPVSLTLGGGVGGVTILPHTIFERCYDCAAADNPCDCLDAEMATYRYRKDYVPTGPNSNTFAGRMSMYCGLIGNLTRHLVPVGAIGWWWTMADFPTPIAVPHPGMAVDLAELREKGEAATARRARYRETRNRPPW